MGDRRGDAPGGEASGKLPDDAAKQAMMFDLGNIRLEDLATDADNNRSRGRQNFQTERRLAPMREHEDRPINPVAARWINAVNEGVFDDYDSRAVRGLDSLDDGNAHRRNGASHIPTRGDQRAQNPGEAGRVNREARQRPSYNPANPGYSRRKPRQSPQPLGQGLRGTSLGGHVPPGGEVRRWDPSGSARVTAAASTPGVGRGAGRGAPIQGVPQHALPEGVGRGRGAPRRLQQPSFRASRPGHTHDGATAQKSVPNTQSPTIKAPTSRSSTSGPSTIRPKVVNSTPTKIPSVTVSQYDKGETLGQSSGTSGRVPKQVSASGSKIPGDDSVEQANQSDGNTHLLPHLRQTPRQVPLRKDEFAVSIPSQQAQASVNCLARSTALLGPSKVIFREQITAKLSVGADKKNIPGQGLIYEQTQEAIIVWEISLDDGRLLRGDIRSCFSPLLTGASAYLRRQGHPTAQVQSSMLTFDIIPTAKKFKQVVDACLEQMKDSMKPKLKETLVDKSLLKWPSGDLRVKSDDKVAETKTIPLAETSPQPFRGARVFAEKVINFNPSESFKGTQSHSSELEGPHCQVHRTAQSVSSPIDLSKPQSNVHTSPTLVSEEKRTARSGTPSPSAAAQDERNVVTQATEPALTDLDVIEAIPLGRNMSQDSLRMLSTVTDQEYRSMINECYSVAHHLGPQKTSKRVEWLRTRALKIAANRLKRYDNFRALQEDEQKKVCAVVYAIVLQGHSPIIRLREDMKGLRSSARPCPDVIRRFNKYVRSTVTPPNSSLPPASDSSDFARSPFTVSRDPELQRQRDAEEEQRLLEEKIRAEEQRRREEEERIAAAEQKHAEVEQQRIEAELRQAEKENKHAYTQTFVEVVCSEWILSSSTLKQNGSIGRVPGSVTSDALSDRTNGQAPATVSNSSPGQDSIYDSQQGEPRQGFGTVAPASPTSPDYKTTNSPTPTSWAEISNDPRGSLLYVADTSPSPSQRSGLSASRWATRERNNSSSNSSVSSDDAPPGGIDANTWNRHNSTGLSVSHSRSDTGDLSSLSGLNDEFQTLELSEGDDSDWDTESCCSW
ncbi:hypothetical protein K449DRAFT_469686 [Hypoxylon sp. EC38]|nr:hypothetical protein K449DRAFT_469686 [Hypoxylon sp. EC38]